MHHRTPLLRVSFSALACTLLLVSLAPPAAAAESSAHIQSPGSPITDIWIGATLGCQLERRGAYAGDFDGDSNDPGDCGTWVLVDGVLYGPDFTTHATDEMDPLTYTPFTFVSQTMPPALGTPDDPWVVITQVAAGNTGILVTEVDSYAAGRPFYDTLVYLDSDPLNGPPEPPAGQVKLVTLYRGGNCDHGGDDGYGMALGPIVGCTQPDCSDGLWWIPRTAGSHYIEAYDDDWVAAMGSHAGFPDTVAVGSHDNAAGLSWGLEVPPLVSAISAQAEHLTYVGSLCPPPPSVPPAGSTPKLGISVEPDPNGTLPPILPPFRLPTLRPALPLT